MKAIFKTAIALVITAGFSTAVFADVAKSPLQSFDIKTRTVSFADLDLAEPTDAQMLIDRIRSTAKKVCRSAHTHLSVQEGKAMKICLNESYKNAILVINENRSMDVEAIAASSAVSREIVVAD
ncbi:MAG: UrcA family protein [Pseudomonadota bacterium]